MKKWLYLGASVYLGVKLIFWWHLISLSPVSSWDVLSYWIPAYYNSNPLDTSELFTANIGSHGNFVPQLMALASKLIGPSASLFFICCFLPVSLIIFLALRGLDNPLFFILLYLSVPLIENHIILYGYTELLLASFLFGAVLFIYKFFRRLEGRYLLTASFFIAVIPLIKSYGLAVSLIVLGASLLTLVIYSMGGARAFEINDNSKQKAHLWALFILVFVSFAGMLAGSSVDLYDTYYGGVKISFFSYRFNIDVHVAEYFWRILSVFSLQSFSLLFISLTTVVVCFLPNKLDKKNAEDFFLVLFSFAFFTALSLLAVFTGYGFHNFLLNDTSMSRVVSVVTPVLLFLMSARLQRFGVNQ